MGNNKGKSEVSSLELVSFQSHHRSKLEFSPGVNVVIGHSDHGKTALIRGLTWLIKNRPSGEEFRSNYAPNDTTQVILKMKPGEIRRGRGKDTNYYWYEGIRYSSFGQDVPQPIVDILNIDDLNIQYQFDAPFLLSESPGSVAKYLNRVINLDNIDETTKNVNTWVKSVNNKLTTIKINLEELNTEITNYPDFNLIDDQLGRLDELNKDIEINGYTIALLEQLLIDIQISKQKLETILIPDININHLIKLSKQFTSTVDTLEEIEKLCLRMEQTQAKISSFPTLTYNLQTLMGCSKEYEQFAVKILELVKITDNINEIDKSIINMGLEIDKCKRKFQGIFPQNCPLCLQPVPQYVLQIQ